MAVGPGGAGNLDVERVVTMLGSVPQMSPEQQLALRGPNFGVGGTPDLESILRGLGSPELGSLAPGGRGSRFTGGAEQMAFRGGLDPSRLIFEDTLRRAGIDPRTVIRLNQGGTTFMPPGSSSGGNPSNTATNTGADTTGMATGIAASLGLGIGGIGETGFNASPSHTADTVGLQADSPYSDAGFAVSPLGDVGRGDVSPSSPVTVSPDGVISIGGQIAGVISGSDAAGGLGVGGSGIGGSDGGGVGMDGSSNAGIGGPGGTGAVGSAGDAGQGTGGPGEGDHYGGHFTVGGRPELGPDSMNVKFKASPGEKVVVIPPGMTAGQILSRPEQFSSWRETGNPPNPGPGPNPSPILPPGTPPGVALRAAGGGAPGGIESILKYMAARPGVR